MQHSSTQVDRKAIIAFAAITVGMFMAVLDIQIVASSLSVIAAGLSASADELSWIQTSYLIAEVIIIPMTGFTARLLSTRISYFIASLGFTLMSLMCALAWNIESMIIFRALQGFFGGAMIPTAFGIIFIIFPKKMQNTITVIVGLVVTIAPTVGPTLGGYITETLSWHFMFTLNVIPGALVCIVVFMYADFDKPNYSLLKGFDLTGAILMAFSLGTLQYILEEGNKKDWFDDTHILILSILVFIGFIWLFFNETKHKNPIVDLTAFKNKNFSFGCIYSFILGVGLFSAVYLLPLFLSIVAGYNSMQIGITMVVTGLSQLLSAPLAGKAMSAGIDKRLILLIGFVFFALGCYTNSFLTSESRFWEFALPQALRGLALMFCFLPINDLALGTIPKERVQNASGLYNLTRNLGGAIGLAVINTIITTKSAFYQQYIKENISLTSPETQDALSMFTQYFTGKVYNPDLAILQLLDNVISREGFILAINHVYIVITGLFLLGSILIPFSSMPKNTEAINAH